MSGPRAVWTLLSTNRAIVVLGLFGLALRIGAQIAVGFYEHPETWEEGTMAADLASGRGYGYYQLGSWHEAFRAPAYPLLLGSLYSVLGTSPIVAGALNAVLGGLTVAAAVALGNRIGPSPSGALTGIGVAAHPGLVVYSAKIHQLNLDALLLLVAAVLIVIGIRGFPMWSAAALGLIGGCIALSRPTGLPFIGLAATLALLRERSGRSVRWGLLVLALTIGITGVWVARNWVATGEPTLSSGTGMFLWIGHNPHATGGASLPDGRSILEADPDLRTRVYGKDEAEQDRLFREAAIEYMSEDPLRAASNIATRFGAFWWFGPTVGIHYPAIWLGAYAGGYALTLALAAAGTLHMWRKGRARELLVIAGLVVTVGLAQAIFYVDGRHRWAVEPLIIAVAAVGLAVAPRNWRRTWTPGRPALGDRG